MLYKMSWNFTDTEKMRQKIFSAPIQFEEIFRWSSKMDHPIHFVQSIITLSFASYCIIFCLFCLLYYIALYFSFIISTLCYIIIYVHFTYYTVIFILKIINFWVHLSFSLFFSYTYIMFSLSIKHATKFSSIRKKKWSPLDWKFVEKYR